MHDPALRPFSGNDSATESWLHRVRENLGQLLIPSHFKPSSANGAPIHLLKLDKSLRPASAQGASLITHAAVFAAIVFTPRKYKGVPKSPFSGERTPLGPSTLSQRHSSVASRARILPSGRGRGGDQNPIPATQGNLPPLSSIVLVRPTLPQNRTRILPEPPTIFDPNAAPVAYAHATTWDCPGWRTTRTLPVLGRATASGRKMAITIGDDGDGPSWLWQSKVAVWAGVSPPACAYCPYPTYTDEARHGKVQGAVTLAVLVGADGRAQEYSHRERHRFWPGRARDRDRARLEVYSSSRRCEACCGGLGHGRSRFSLVLTLGLFAGDSSNTC